MSGMQSYKTTLTKTKSGSEPNDWKVGHLTSLGGLQIDADEIETTDFDSGGFREFIPSFKDAGEVAIEGRLKSESDFSKLLALQDSGTVEQWTIQFKSGATLVFNAFVKTAGTTDGGMDDAVGFSGALRVSGKPTFTPAGSASS